MKWIQVVLVTLSVAVLGQLARADEIDTTVTEGTTQGFLLHVGPTTIVFWQIVGEFEDFNITIPDIFELFQINEVPGRIADA